MFGPIWLDASIVTWIAAWLVGFVLTLQSVEVRQGSFGDRLVNYGLLFVMWPLIAWHINSES